MWYKVYSWGWSCFLGGGRSKADLLRVLNTIFSDGFLNIWTTKVESKKPNGHIQNGPKIPDITRFTPLKTNMEPENDGFLVGISSSSGSFSGSMLVFGECITLIIYRGFHMGWYTWNLMAISFTNGLAINWMIPKPNPYHGKMLGKSAFSSHSKLVGFRVPGIYTMSHHKTYIFWDFYGKEPGF